ncbi:MAG: extracellular solute-binding protein [Chloroflexi bacterium]|nr:MAG: extracellular solute-binding protein [Chloroflexota bacterium]
MARQPFGRKAVTAATIALTLVLAACSGGNGASTAPAGSAAALSGEIRVVHAWAGAEGDAFKQVVAGFSTANPGVKVTLVQVPFDDLNSQMIQQFSAGSPPDVVSVLPGLIHTLAKQDLLMPLDDVWDKWVSDSEYSASIRTIGSYSGHAYGVFFKGNVNALIWHRNDVLQQLGISDPSSWSDFTAALDKIKSGGKYAPFAVGAKDVWVPTQWSDAFLAKVAGADKFNGLIDGSVKWDDPDVVKAFQTFSDFVKSYFPSNALDIGFTDANCEWASQKKAVFQNQGAFVNLTTPANCGKDLDPKKDYTFFEMPAPNPAFSDVHFVSGDLFAVAKATKNPSAAKAFAEYLGSADAQAIWAKLGGFIAPNAKTDPSVYPTDNDRKAAKLFSQGTAVYDLDDAIGGQVQTVEREELKKLIQTHDVNAFIKAMVDASSGAGG